MRKEPPKRAGIEVVLPITADEVRVMWQAVAKPPHPQLASCQDLAETLTSCLYHGSAEHILRRRHSNAASYAKLLLQEIGQLLEPTRNALRFEDLPSPHVKPTDLNRIVALEKALEEALPILRPEGSTLGPPAPIWEEAAHVAWIAACHALNEIERKTGDTAKAVAVKFAAHATNRMGFDGVTPNALAKRLEKLRTV